MVVRSGMARNGGRHPKGEIDRDMGGDHGFAAVFASLRAVLEPYAKEPGFVHLERDGMFQLSSTRRTDRIGRPLSVAAAQVNRSYVSFHLLPIYMNPTLQAAVPVGLKQRMHGKSCFNFTAIDADQLEALTALTRRAIASFADVKLPWDQPQPGKRNAPRSRP